MKWDMAALPLKPPSRLASRSGRVGLSMAHRWISSSQSAASGFAVYRLTCCRGRGYFFGNAA